MGAVIIKNLSQVLAGLEGKERWVNEAAYKALGVATEAVADQAKKNADTGSHPRGEGHLPGTGPGPNVVTGNLRRMITTEVKYGFGHYVGVVSSNAEYARQVELGGGKWKSGVKYPYLAPAAEEMRRNGQVAAKFLRAFVGFMGRG